MAGVGEASAIVGIVSLGFSIAAALNTYVSGVSAARDDVSSLSSEIEATLAHLRGLDNLIKKNEDTKAWDSDGLELANRAIEDCERIIKRLRRLLQKASWNTTNKEELEGFVKNEIDLSKFERVFWPRLKPDLDLCKGELQRIKLNILLATSAYTLGTVTTDADKVKHRQMIRGVMNAKKWNEGKMRRVRENGKPHMPGLVPSRRVNYHSATAGNYGRPEVEDEIEMELNDDFERFLNQEQAKKEEEQRRLLLDRETQQRAQMDAKTRKIEEKAIKDYVEKLKKTEAEAQKKRDELRQKLGQRGLTSQQIDIVVDEALPMQNDNISLLLRHTKTSSAPSTEESAASTNPDTNNANSRKKMPKKSRLWNFFQPNKGDHSGQAASSRCISSAWRDPATKTGFANLESWFISRTGDFFAAPTPQPWMLQPLIDAENGLNRGSAKQRVVKQAWEIFHSLPSQLAMQTNNLLEERAARRPEYDWSILWLAAANEQERNKKTVQIGPFKFHIDDLENKVEQLYVILKYEDKNMRAKVSEGANPRSKSPEPTYFIDASSKEATVNGPLEKAPDGKRVASPSLRLSKYDDDAPKFYTYLREPFTHKGYPPPAHVSFSSSTKPHSGEGPKTAIKIMPGAPSQHDDAPPAKYFAHGDAYAEAETLRSSAERERSYHGRLPTTTQVPQQPACHHRETKFHEQKFADRFDRSHHPTISAERMASPMVSIPPPPSGIHDARHQWQYSYHNMSPNREQTHYRIRSRSPVPENASNPLIYSENRNFNIHNDVTDLDRLERKARVPAYVQDADENDEPVFGTRYDARYLPVRVRSRSNHQGGFPLYRDQYDKTTYANSSSDEDDCNRPFRVARSKYKQEFQPQPMNKRSESRIIEEDENQSEEEIADRVVAKLTRLSIEDISIEEGQRIDGESHKEVSKEKSADLCNSNDEYPSSLGSGKDRKGKESVTERDASPSLSSSRVPSPVSLIND